MLKLISSLVYQLDISNKTYILLNAPCNCFISRAKRKELDVDPQCKSRAVESRLLSPPIVFTLLANILKYS